MRTIFDNGATRARARAWGLWLLSVAGGGGFLAVCDAASAWDRLCLLLALGLASGLILVRRRPRRIPVLNYHSVSAQPDWLQIADRVSLTPAAFERQLAYLKRNDYRSLFIGEVRDRLAGVAPLGPREKCVALTFDDGYADNWVAAFPLLRKYGMKATLFVSSDFVGEAEGCRPTVESVAEGAKGGLDWSGYLTWPELRAMRASGLVEIQSHGQAHTRLFAGPELRGFVGPGKPNLWLLWNSRPEARRCWWRELAEDRSLWGQPVFRQAPALACRAYRPDPGAVAHLQAWGKARPELFARPDWERCLREEWRRHARAGGECGELESEEAYRQRVADELKGSKRVLERELGVTVDVLCWPENAFSEAGERVARQVGYSATVSSRHSSRNAVGEAPDSIVRVFVGSHVAGVAHPLLDFAGFVLELRVFEGDHVWYPLLAVAHMAKRLVFGLRSRLGWARDYSSVWR